MKLHLPTFDSARVLVIGDLMLDRYWHGDATRISPEAPVPVVHVGAHEERAGGAGNVALNVAALGAEAGLIGLVGHDEAAVMLQEVLTKHGVDCHFLPVNGTATITKLRVISRHQQLIRLDFEDGFGQDDAEPIAAKFKQHAQAGDVVVLSDYGKGTLADVQNLIRAARAQDCRVLVDPKGRDFTRYRGATLMTPNLAEFEAVVGECADEVDLVNRGQQLRADLELDALLITRSDKGMTLLQADEPPLHLPTHAREVFDVTGAGDTVIAVLAAALAAAEPIQSATALANVAAGIVVGKLGTATVSMNELQRALRDESALDQGIVSETHLVDLIVDCHGQQETVVMTNGCFDILHAGHVRYLQQARALGDRLVVAVNDDDSVRRLKGKQRPVNNLEQRMLVLASLGCVDWVVPFSEDTPERLICAVHPDVLVKGGDYHPDEIAGGECVKRRGGRVVVLDFVKGCSTTGLIEAIKQQD